MQPIKPFTPPDRAYPKFLFFLTAEQTVSSTRVNSKADHDALIGSEPDKYFESPDEAKSGKASTMPRDPNAPLESAGAGRPLGYEPKGYPKVVFTHVGEGRCETKIVHNPDDLAALKNYFESPGEAIAGKANTDATTSTADSDAARGAVDSPAPSGGDVLSASDVQELYDTKVADVVASVSTCPDVATLNAILAAESRNPKGARKSVTVAISTRLSELATVK